MEASKTPEQGPYLSAALICEKVLEEKDGVKSAIRIIDRVTRTVVGPSPPEEMGAFDWEGNLLVRLKSGRARGTLTLEVRLIKPSGEGAPSLRHTVFFEGEEDRGVDVVVGMRIKFDQTGIYWFKLQLGGTLLTQIPLRVIYMPQVMQVATSGGPPTPTQPPSGEE